MGGFQAKKASAFPTSHWHMESICDKGGRSVPIKGMFFPHTWGKTGNLVVGGCRLTDDTCSGISGSRNEQ